MASVNIGEANQGDAFYRYKMPKLQSRIQGRGNGIKTEVVNNVEVAKALERPPEYILKFYGCELGAQTNFDKKTGVSIVNGAHDTKTIAQHLETFIKKYVQCYDCHNPETMIKIKRENISLKCKACGFSSGVDMGHRLNTYILKNPPEEKVSKAEKKLKSQEKERLKEAAGENLDKEEKRRKKKEKASKKSKKDEDQNGNHSPNAEEEHDEEDEGEVEWLTDTSAAAAKARAQEQLTAGIANMVTQGNIEAEQEAARKREEKRKAEEEAARKAQEEAERRARDEVERRAREEAEKQAKEEAEKTAAESPVEILRKSLKEDKPDATAKLCEGFDVQKGPAERSSFLVEALLGGQADGKVELCIKTHQAVLKSLAKDKPGQMALLIALEHVLTSSCSSQLTQVTRALKGFYDNDIVIDSIIIAWHNAPGAGKALGVELAGAQKIRTSSKPFIDWLEASEDESDEESDEE